MNSLPDVPGQWVDRSPKIQDCYHAMTKGIPTFDLYESEDDFVVGMNMTGILARNCGVTVLASKLNDSHEHHVLSGNYEDCRLFLNRHVEHAKGQIRFRRKREGMAVCPQPSLELSILPIETEYSLRNRIAYVIKNSFDSGLPFMPWWDDWSTAKVYFADYRMLLAYGRPIPEFGNILEQRRVFHTNVPVPQEWRADDRGLICPVWYTDYIRVNSIFRTPESFLRYLTGKKTAEAEEQIQRSVALEVSVQSLREVAKAKSLDLFGTKDIQRLNEYQKVQVCKDLLAKGASVAQLQRVVHIPSERLRHLLR